MPTFELTAPDNSVYHVDAPDEHSAVAALKQASGGNPFEQYRQKPANPFAEYAPAARGGEPIHIGAPDGSVVEFPAGTSDDTIKAAMGKAYPPPSKRVTDPALLAQLNGDEPSALRSIREALHAPTRALENGVLLGLGDRARAAMDSVLSGGGYGQHLKDEQAATEEFQKAHPVAAPVLEGVGGAIAPIGVIGAASKGVGLGSKMLLGAGAGGTIGGVQGALSSKDWTDVRQTAKDAGTGAAIGGVIGGAIPAAGRAIGAGYRAVSNAVNSGVEGMSRGAGRHLVSAMEADTPAAVRSRMAELGPDAMLADAGPAFLGKAQGASLNSDEGRSVLQSALTNRNTGTNARIQSDVDHALGPAQDPQGLTDTIRARRIEIDSKAYPSALDAAPPVKLEPIMIHLADKIDQTPVGSMEHKALSKLQDMLTKKVKKPVTDVNGDQVYDSLGHEKWRDAPESIQDANVIHKVKGELDAVINHDAPGLGVPAGALSRQQASLKEMRHAINGALELQVPGYKSANETSAMMARRAEAVEKGSQYLGSGKTTPSPDYFAGQYGKLSPDEMVAFQKGSRGEIERLLGVKANDLQALRSELQGEGGWNTAKLGTVHGQPAADELVNTVDRNLKFRDTYNKVVENSQTAQRQAAAREMKPEPSSETPLFGPASTMTGMTATIARKGVQGALNAITRSDPTRHYGEVARALSEQGAARDKRIKAIVDALNGRQVNAAAAPQVGNTAALLSAIAAGGYLRSRRDER